MININFCKLNENATIPTKAHKSDAGFDLYSDSDVVVPAGNSAIVKTGIGWEPDTDMVYMQLKSRSGLAFKSGIECTNAGVIDSGYRGEICIKLYNHTDKHYLVHKGDRIAQGVIVELPEVSVHVVENLGNSDRNTNGFGSTGSK